MRIGAEPGPTRECNVADPHPCGAEGPPSVEITVSAVAAESGTLMIRGSVRG